MSDEDHPQKSDVSGTRKERHVNGLKCDISDEDPASKGRGSKPKNRGQQHDVSKTTEEHDVKCDISDEDQASKGSKPKNKGQQHDVRKDQEARTRTEQESRSKNQKIMARKRGKQKLGNIVKTL